MVRNLLILVLTLSVCMSAIAFNDNEQCTSILITPRASAEGAPILWKNRDTSQLSNRVVFVDDQPFSYLALVDGNDPSGRRCFAGLNSAGFGIINTVAYNLPAETDEVKDQEGTIMADALRTCKTVDDFQQYLEDNRGKNLGSLANFGVMDATGRILLFEAHNHGFTIQDPAKEETGYLVNTNFARSGKENKGAGYLRFKRATQLVDAIDEQPISFRDILTRFSRDTGHVLLHTLTLADLKTGSASPDWISTKDCINKYHTSACVVMVGGKDNRPATMWVIPGEPITAVALPLWVEAGTSPEPFREGDPDAALWAETLRIKNILRPLTGGNQTDYLYLPPLFNTQKTGIRDRLDPLETSIINETLAFLEQPRTPEELKKFQAEMAEKALAALKQIQ